MIEQVVFIDDNVATNFIHEKFFEMSGKARKIHTFLNGQKALDFLSNCIPQPELIFVDINMPSMDAWEFLNKLKNLANFDLSKSKLFVLTTSLSPQDRGHIINQPNITEVLIKPLDQNNIQSLMKRYF